MPRPIDLIHLQISLEYQLDDHGMVIPFPGSSEQALYIVYRYSGGYLPFVNHKLPILLLQKLNKLGPKAAFTKPGVVNRILDEYSPGCCGGEDIFWSGYFNHKPQPDDYPDATHDGDSWVVHVDGQVASRAISIRQNESCAEVYIETHPGFRKRGYGRQVVSAWAQNVLGRGLEAFYSYKQSNLPSASLASSLGVQWYADVVSFSPPLSEEMGQV